MVTNVRRVSSIVLVTLLCMQWGCQLPTQPTADRVPVTLKVRVHDQGGNAVPGASDALIHDSSQQVITPTSSDLTASSWTYALTVPITGDRYTAIAYAPPPQAFTTYVPQIDTARFVMPCRDTTVIFEWVKHDSVPCNTLTAEATLDFGTICLDRDTAVTLTTPDFIHGCSGGATIQSITTPSISGLTFTPIFRNPDQPVVTPAAWPAGRPIALEATFTTANRNIVIFDGQEAVIDASPNAKITVHLKGRVVACDSCNCPNYDTVSFGLATVTGTSIDTNEVSLGDAPKLSKIDLTRIVNASACDLLFTRSKDFTNDQLRATALNGSDNSAFATLPSKASMTGLNVAFTPKRTGEVTDTTVYRIQKRSKTGELSDCDSLVIIYHGHVGLGMCAIDTAATNASSLSYLKNDTITNCISANDDYRYLCIKNIGDGTLHTTLPFAINDPRFYIVNESTGNKYQGEDVVIAKGGRFCFSIHYVPTSVGPLASNSFTACAGLPIHGRVKDPCINCLDGGLRQYQVTPTSFQGFLADSNAFLFVSDQNTQLSIYARTVTATTVTFQTMLATTFKLVQTNYSLSSPLITLCDDKSAIATGKGMCGLGSNSITVGVHDLILFSPVPGKCGLIYIDNIHNSNGIVVVDFQATYPIN